VGTSDLNAFARLRAGVSRRRAEASLGGLLLVSLDEQSLSGDRTALTVMAGAVVCVLLIACANVGGLQLERTLARRRELAVRVSLGAARGRLIRQWLTESLVLAMAGGTAGLLLATLTLPLLVSLLPASLPHVAQIAVNGRTLAAAWLAAAAAGLLSGIAPLLHMSEVAPGSGLARLSRSTTRGASWTRRVLVATEVALSVMLVVGAALLIQTFAALAPSKPGFDYSHKLTTEVGLPQTLAAAPERPFADLIARVQNTPGVRAVTASTYIPMSGTTTSTSVALEGAPVRAVTAQVMPNYFTAMNIAVRSGRTFTDGDARSSMPVSIVNESLARKLRAGAGVLGARVTVLRRGQPPVQKVIVGIVGDTRSLGSNTRPFDEFYEPFAQRPGPMLHLFVETDGRQDAAVAAAMRANIRALSPDMILEPVTPLVRMLDRTVSRQRFNASLLGLFAALAVGLAAAGLMTMIGWWVSQRTREIGVRMALGATHAQVRGLVVRQGLAIAFAGIVIGLAGASAGTRYIASFLYGVTALDARTFAGAAVVMLLTAIIAVSIPVRRAVRVNPTTALRAE
jgi:putative ABC transport system permease protein